ncbi:PAS domain S-box protein [Mariniflexile jejuense]|uniref:histidine kinase n=1 Tax=Mariniflexile jejuense TaxID=1173582 RepID=A0ABW3JF25_9FLAO
MKCITKRVWNNNQEEQLVDAINNSALVSITDPKGLIISANEAFCQISGYTELELLGKSHNILKSGIQSDSIFIELWNTIINKNIWQGEICNKKKDGTFYWVKATIVPFLNSFGDIEKYVAILFDISKLKESKDQVIRVQNKFKLFFDRAPYSFLVTNSNGKILDCNATTETLSGYSRNELINKKISNLNLLSKTDYSYLSKVLKIQSAKSHKIEFLIKTKKGDNIDVEILPHHINFEGETIVLIIIQNISIRKKILKELQEKKNDLELLLYRSGHDLRTPFTTLEGLVNLLKIEKLNESSFEILEMIETVLNDGKILIDNLSTASLMINSSITNDEINLNKLVNKVIKNLSQIEGFNTISFNINIPENLIINSNLQMISSLLQNIIQNAIKYQRPISTIHTPFIIINAFKTASGFEINFKDNGLGINAKELDKIFNLYYRSHNTIEGTGLGLYITKNIVQKLNGTIRVKSILNEMTQFDINIPNS